MQFGLEVLAPLWAAIGALAPAAEQVAEQTAEIADVAFEVERMAPTRRAPARTEAAKSARPDARRHQEAPVVVLGALGRVPEHVVRGGNLLEALFGVLVSGVGVGV